MRTDGRGPSGAVALLAYTALSVVFFGRGILAGPAHVVEGLFGRDQSISVWSLSWLAHSLSHLHSPFLTHDVFAPSGYNLAWATSIFGPGLLVLPVSLTLGPVVSFNLLALAAPATAAWAAFLLCRHVSGSARAAFAAGLLYGFGAYEGGEMVDHLPLALSFIPPLVVLLVLRRHADQIGRRTFSLALGALIALQLWIDTELLASMVLFGVLAFTLAALIAPAPSRARLLAVAADVLLAVPVTLLLVLPYLVYAVDYPNPVGGIRGGDAGADVANFILPTTTTWLHGTGALARAASRMRGNISEQLAYLGIPLVLVLTAFTLEFRRRTAGRVLAALLVLSAVLSLGAHPYLDGERSDLVLPWYPFSLMPVLRFAIPGRFVIYTWLAAAVAVALWLSRPSRSPARWAAFGVVCAFLVPNLTSSWGTRVDRPSLLTEPMLARYVPARATVLALPFGIAGSSMYWQVQAQYRFRLAGGYLSVSLPAAYQRYRHLIRVLEGKTPAHSVHEMLCRFLSMTRTQVILLRDHVPGPWDSVLASLDVRPHNAGGFRIYLLGAGGTKACQPSSG